jgi:hypothetical protein
MNEHSASSFSDGAKKTLSDAVLVVRVYTTERDSLTLLGTTCMEVFGSKYTIVSMVAFDDAIVLRSQKFKAVF